MKSRRDFEQLVKSMQEYRPELSLEKLEQVYAFADDAYSEHKRYSGDPVLHHVLETAKILATHKVDEDTVMAALLHEIPEYTNFKISDIEKKFGKNVADLVTAFEKLGAIRSTHNDSDVEKLRKMFLVMAKDLRVVLIKLADRLHNMRTLEYVKEEKQKGIARETMDVYVPIASRLGVYGIRSQLEDLCFKFLYPKEFELIKEQLKQLGKKRKYTLEEVSELLKSFLEELNIPAQVSGRFKNSYSIFKKLKNKGKTSIDDIHDIFALRIVLENENLEDLYHLVSLIHKKWEPLSGRFKDYVGYPKPNGYRSLHTTVQGMISHSTKDPVEIQIRTERMHDEAEYGVASHWLYKQNKGSLADDARFKAQMAWIKSLENMNSLTLNFFKDRIFVFTPQGEIKDFPVGATPLDFAYEVHTDLGNRCVMAKANGSVVPIDYELQNGDVIEIMTRSDAKPKLEWLNFVQTSGAQSKIKAYFRNLNKEDNFKAGKELLNEQLKKIGKKSLDANLSILEYFSGNRLSLKEREGLVETVGVGAVLPSNVIKKVYEKEYLERAKEKKKHKEEKSKSIPVGNNLEKNIMVGGEKGLSVRIAQCCKPSYGQPIIGYTGRGYAVSIHKKNCNILAASNPERYISAKWI